MLVKKLDSSRIQITINSNLYSNDIIYKCLYWYNGKYSIDIVQENDCFCISIEGIKTDDSIEKIITKIKSDLIDFKTREIVFHETKNIREMLIAKAFAHEDDFDESPPQEISNPLGNNQNNI